ncbi:MAG: cyclic nucleotide-binding domain-containing protein, partial [Mariprofundaceae bacterium]
MIPDLPSEADNQDESEKVYADLVNIYPDNEGYLRQYAEILLKTGKVSTATVALKKLHTLLEKTAPDKASALSREFPQIGRITKIEAEQSGDTELGQILRKAFGTLWIKLYQKRVKEGHCLYAKGVHGDTLALVIKGEMAVCIPGKNHTTVLLNLIGPDDVVGEACFLNPGARSAEIVANKDSVIIEIPRNKLVNYLIENPGAEKLLEEKADFRQLTSMLSTNDLLQDVPLDMRKYMAGTTRTERYK